MSKHLPAASSATRVIHYVDVAARPSPAKVLAALPPGEVVVAAIAALAQQQHHTQRRTELAQRAQYDAWLRRQQEIRRHDRRVRRIAAVAVPAGLLGLAGLGWLLANSLTVSLAGLGPVAVGVAVVLAVAGLAAGGRRCVTVLQHWHE